LEKLYSTDIFALASVVDDRGGSDVFPTVILEAMAATRPVVSTRLAGIPELVVDEETGLLVSPGDTSALANALDRLLGDPQLRLRYANAGRARIEQQFRIEETVAPLIRLLQTSPPVERKQTVPCRPSQIAYLIDRWPDTSLASLERELNEMQQRNVPIVPFVCELDSAAKFVPSMDGLARQLEFLPSAMAIESEWQSNGTLTQQLEQTRAQEEHRVPAAIFLRQARFALPLRKLLTDRKIAHVHATSSRALVCALILQSIVDLSVSATIEPNPELPENWIQTALLQCKGGRLSDRGLLKALGSPFMFDMAAASAPKKVLQTFQEKIGIDLTREANFWRKWSELLAEWNQVQQGTNQAR
jgi:hypothetical protein